MENQNYKPRIIDKKIETYLKIFGAICIEGPKWCGKTWTATHHCNSLIKIGDPAEQFKNREMARNFPDLVLEGENPRLIDEWQEVPALWDAVRYNVDERGSKGLFILTGSATPPHKGILHSGAGRFAKLRMRPMSLYDSGDSSGKVSLQELCNGQLNAVNTGEVSLDNIIKFIIRGGWPGSIDLPSEYASELPKEYIKAVISDDINNIDGTSRSALKMNLLLRSLARNESTTVSNNTLNKDILTIQQEDNVNKRMEDLSKTTISEYLDILERLFLLDNQKPFSVGLRSSVRIKQSEKRHFADPSLAAALLNATPKKLKYDLRTLGFLFEALVERDLKIYAESFNAQLFHYQDYNNKEIDAVIELEDGDWCAFEIKLGAAQIEEAANNLLKIKQSFEEDPKGIPPKILCVICGTSNAAYKRPDGVFVVPITALKN